MPARPEILDAHRFGEANRRRLSGPGVRTFLRIAELWRLSENERRLVLGLPGRSTYYSWISRARAGQELKLSVDTLLRISAVLGIIKALRSLFDTDEEGVAWLRSPHDAPTFGGDAPIRLMTSGTQDGLMLVRRYLEGMMGGLFASPNAADRGITPLSDDDILLVC